MNGKTFGVLFWLMVTFLVVGIVLVFAIDWFGDGQDQTIIITKKTEDY